MGEHTTLCVGSCREFPGDRALGKSREDEKSALSSPSPPRGQTVVGIAWTWACMPSDG